MGHWGYVKLPGISGSLCCIGKVASAQRLIAKEESQVSAVESRSTKAGREETEKVAKVVWVENQQHSLQLVSSKVDCEHNLASSEARLLNFSSISSIFTFQHVFLKPKIYGKFSASFCKNTFHPPGLLTQILKLKVCVIQNQQSVIITAYRYLTLLSFWHLTCQ